MKRRRYFTCGNNCEICLKRFTCQVHNGENIPVVNFELDSDALEDKMKCSQTEKERKAIWEIAKFHGLNFDEYVENDSWFKNSREKYHQTEREE